MRQEAWREQLTNRPDVRDPALLRPGRFDRQVVLDPPDRQGRDAILRIHTSSLPLAPDVRLGSIAQATADMSGADLANLANEAALTAARRGRARSRQPTSTRHWITSRWARPGRR